jgi:hypothetical protein
MMYLHILSSLESKQGKTVRRTPKGDLGICLSIQWFISHQDSKEIESMLKTFDLKAFLMAIIINVVILGVLLFLPDYLQIEGILNWVFLAAFILAVAFMGAAYGRFHRRSPEPPSRGHIALMGALMGLIIGFVLVSIWEVLTENMIYLPMNLSVGLVGALIGLGGALFDYKKPSLDTPQA